MGRLLAVFFAFLIMASTALESWSKGIFITPGAREGSMGAAMVPVADDATAVYYNPAGLAQQSGKGFQAAFFYLSEDAKSNQSLGNTAAPNAIGGDFPLRSFLPSEPSQYRNKNFSTGAVIPFAGGYMNSKGITYALAVYGAGGGGGKWKDSIKDSATGTDTINALLEGLYSFVIYNISAAKQVTPDISVGLGLDVVNMMDSKNVQKSYDRGAGTAMPMNYQMAIDQSASGYGLQYNGGMMYKFGDKFTAGLVLRSGTIINLKGKANSISVIPAVGANQTDQTDYDYDYTYPMTYGAGVSYVPAEKWTIAVGVDHNNYASMHETVKYKTPNSFFQDSARPLSGREWKDTNQIRLGAEYRHSDKLSFRSGIQTDPIPFSADYLTLIELNQYSLTYYTVGVGYKLGMFRFDFCYANCVSDPLSLGDRSFEYPLDVFRLGMSCNF